MSLCYAWAGMGKWVALGIFTAAAMAATSANAAPLVTNGDFSTGDLTGWTPPSDASSFFVYGNALHAGPTGDVLYISQTIDTTPGQGYYLTFSLSNGVQDGASPGADLAPNAFVATVSDAPPINLTDAVAFDWTQYQLNFVATSDKTDLSFGFRNDPSYFAITNIAVAVPEPVSIGFACVSAGLLVLRPRRR